MDALPEIAADDMVEHVAVVPSPGGPLEKVQLDDGDHHELRVRAEKKAQFKKLKDNAQALFGEVRGVPGVRTPEKWAEMLDAAGDEIGNGRFIVRQLGAERYLDPETVAVLLTLRQSLIADLRRPTAADVMMIDCAVVAYYNFLRAQGWIANLSLVVERELFGEEPLNAYHGESAAQHIEEKLRRLSEVILPLQDRAHRMMMRSLAALRAPTGARSAAGCS